MNISPDTHPSLNHLNMLLLFLSVFYSVLSLEGKAVDWCDIELLNTPDVQFEENALHYAYPREEAKAIGSSKEVSSFQECVQKCCSNQNCNVAFLLEYTCFLIKCNNSMDNSCRPIKSFGETTPDSSYWLMVRTTDNAFQSSLETPQIFVSTAQPASTTISSSLINQNSNGVVANAGGNQSINLPISVVVLNGTKSKDSSGEIVKYIWMKDPSSPAAGEILFDSDKSPFLHLTNLVPGRYKFVLQVSSSRNFSSQDQMTLTVNPDPFQLNLVNMHLKANLSDFRESHLITLKTEVALILRMATPSDIINVNIRKVIDDPSLHQVIIQFYIEQISNKDESVVWSAVKVVDVLEERFRFDVVFREFEIGKLETTVCQNDCSGHGFCDQMTRLCICNFLWIPNFFSRRPNCDWNVINVALFFATIFVFLSVLACIIVCICRKKCCNKWKGSYKPFSIMSRKNRSKAEFMFKDQSIGLMDNLMDESDDEEEETHFQGKSISKVPINNLIKKKINA